MGRTHCILALACTVACAWLLLTSFRRGWTHVETDFPNYYTAAVLTLHHKPLRQFYEWTWFQREMNYAGTERQLGGYIPHTPFTMMPLLPLAWLPPQRAKQTWLVISLLSLAASVWILARLTGFNPIAVLALALLSWTALRENLILGQYYLFLLVLLALAVWCLLRERPLAGGALMGVIFALKLYTAPFALFFAFRREWRALVGMLLGVGLLIMVATAMFGFNEISYFATAVFSRAVDASINDPYNTGWSSMASFLRHLFVPEAELNPHPLMAAPVLFFLLRDSYALSILGLALLARDEIDPRHSLAWFLIVLLTISPCPAQYHFVLLLVPVILLLPGARVAWGAGLVALYALVELPLFAPWYEAMFPRAWLLLALFFGVGWRSLRAAGARAVVALLTFVVAVSAAHTWRSWNNYQEESTRVAMRAVVDPYNIFSSAPALAGGRLVYEKIDRERYLLVEWRGGAVRELVFSGEAFHPALAQSGDPIYFELVAGGHSRICAFSSAGNRLETVVGPELDPTEPAISPDGKILAFVSRDVLYLLHAGKRTVVEAAGPVSNPAFFPDSQRIAFAEGPPGRRILRSVALTGGQLDTLASTEDSFAPAISPDSRWLAYVVSSHGERQVWLMDLASRVRNKLTTGACQNQAPAWRSDSRAVVFTSDCDRGLGLPSLFVLPLSLHDTYSPASSESGP
jgi:hypothetical protein